VTTIPTYLLWVIGGILPMVAVIVGLTTILVNRSTTRREHALDVLKWAGEQAVKQDNIPANRVGVRTLDALRVGSVIGRSDKDLLWAINQAVLASTSAYPERTDTPIDVEDADE